MFISMFAGFALPKPEAAGSGYSSFVSIQGISKTRNSITIRYKVLKTSPKCKSILFSANIGSKTYCYKTKKNPSGCYSVKLTGLHKNTKYKIYSDLIKPNGKHASWVKYVKTSK